MSTNDMVLRIILEYKTTGSDMWKLAPLSAEEYFELSPREPPTLESVSVHDHAIDYLDVDRKSVQITRLTLVDTLLGEQRTIIETFWNHGQNRIIERLDTGPRPYWEMIVETKISDAPATWEILRIIRQDAVMKPIYHGIIRENANGSQAEDKFELS